MDRAKEIALLEELQGLKDNGLFFLDDDVTSSPIERYGSPDRFARERQSILRTHPVIMAHASELAGPGDFMTRDLFGTPLLLTRDREGTVNAFINVCRHRGARLVNDDRGCKHAFSCPYHAWTWSNQGALRGIPHEKPGFPGIDREAYALKRVPVHERFGFIWGVADPASEPDFDTLLDPLAQDFAWLEMENLGVAQSDIVERRANWKLLIEGGIEAYHFKVAHRDTIGPHFLDNLSSYERLGPHLRSILPRTSLPDLQAMPREEWHIRDHANVLYTVFPTSQFLAMQDHISWVEVMPVSHELTRLRLTTLAPRDQITPEMEAHWARNQTITGVTLSEDFEINEAVQAGIASGANTALTFGRYEGALDTFNKEVESRLQ